MRHLPLLLLATFTAAEASAQSFGSKGTMSPSGWAQLSYVRNSPPEGPSASATSLSLAPSAVLFVADNIGVGLIATLTQMWVGDVIASDYSSNQHGLGGMFVWNLPLSERASLMPSANLLIERETSESVILGQTVDTAFLTAALGLSGQLLLHFGNFFVGFGPMLKTDLWSQWSSGGADADGSKQTIVGLGASVGGWIDLAGGSAVPHRAPLADDGEPTMDI